METVAYNQVRGEPVEEEVDDEEEEEKVVTLLFQVRKVERSCAVAYSGIMKMERRKRAKIHYQENF